MFKHYEFVAFSLVRQVIEVGWKQYSMLFVVVVVKFVP